MNLFERVIIEPFARLTEKVLLFLPNFLISLLLLAVGIVVGWLLKVILTRILRAIRLDSFFETSGMTEVMKKGGIEESLSGLLSKVMGWIIMVVFAVIAMRALEIPTVERLLERFLLYLPHVFASVVIFFIGYLLSNFMGRAALIASVNAGIKVSGLIGKFVRLAVLILAVTMSLEQLGIGSGTVAIAFAILFGGVVLALSIAFGLGGRQIAREYLEEKMHGEGEEDEINHI
ncbi:MAG: hypothetical protein HZA17_08865 [Nitrospirae bacterium]|nr:hypothetical protein [Nitrospirota bacterium]